MISCNKIDGALGCSSIEPSFRSAGGEIVGVPDSEPGTIKISVLPLRLAFGEPSLLIIESRGDFDNVRGLDL